jgi:hypothetical protein
VQSSAGKLARRLLEAGYSLDFISDAQLQGVEAVPGAFRAPGGAHYKMIVVPKTGRMPVETLSALLNLQRRYARVLFEALPVDVPGHGRLAQRREQFARLLASDEARHAIQPELARTLEEWGATREDAADLGLWFSRRHRDFAGYDYFLVNATANRIAGWMQLDTAGGQPQWMDPLTGESGRAATSPGRNGAAKVYVLLDSGQSLILRTFSGRALPDPVEWRYLEPAGEAHELAAGWKVDFLHGGPELPDPVSLAKLASWTSLADADAGRFSGTARYSLRFDAPAESADDWRLDLGDVRETARVTLNGKFLGTVWSLPASIRVGNALEPGSNVLEIEVTNLPANRIRDLDLRKVDWKVMKDINLASLRYRALDAATWDPAPSGLLGPVRLVPLAIVSPKP